MSQQSWKILQTFSILSEDFSPSEGQSLHLLSITIPAAALWQSSPLVTFVMPLKWPLLLPHQQSTGRPGQSPTAWCGALQTVQSTRVWLQPCLWHPPIWLLSAFTLYSWRMEISKNYTERALRSDEGLHYAINRILARKVESYNLKQFKNSKGFIWSRIGIVLKGNDVVDLRRTFSAQWVHETQL